MEQYEATWAASTRRDNPGRAAAILADPLAKMPISRVTVADPTGSGAWWRRARKSSGSDSAWRLHDLRHWSATVAITSGHDVRTVAGRLGCAKPAMTLRVYAHAVEAADEAVARTIGAALSPEARAQD